MTDDDRDAETLIRNSAIEMAGIDRTMGVEFRAQTVMEMVALLQLADRHPAIAPNLRATIRAFVDGARAYFEDCPAVLELIRRGDEPAFDVHREDDVGVSFAVRRATEREQFDALIRTARAKVADGAGHEECTHDPARFMTLVFAYYHDADRADRTPRSWMYLHLGQLTGVIARLLHDGNDRPQ